MEKVVWATREAEDWPYSSRTENEGGWVCYAKGRAYSFRKYLLSASFVPDTEKTHLWVQLSSSPASGSLARSLAEWSWANVFVLLI